MHSWVLSDDGFGVAPDVLVDQPASAYMSADPALNAAIALLR